MSPNINQGFISGISRAYGLRTPPNLATEISYFGPTFSTGYIECSYTALVWLSKNMYCVIGDGDLRAELIRSPNRIISASEDDSLGKDRSYDACRAPL